MSTSDLPLLQNPALAAFLLAFFIKEYQERTASTELPSFEKILLVLPLIFHEPSRQAILSKNFATPLHAAIEDGPLIIDRISDRISAYSRQTGIALNICCASGLIKANRANNGLTFSFLHQNWPRGSQPRTIPKKMLNSLSRLANWFKDMSVAELYQILRII